MSLTVTVYPFGPLTENTYLIKDDASGLCAVLDPGHFGDDIVAAIEESAGLKYILLTHGHYDHFAACQDYLDNYPGVEFAAPESDTKLMYGCRDNKWISLDNSSRTICPEASILLNEGDVLTLGETELRVIETPGHTGGGITFAADNITFTGDTLFRLSVGNTSLETGNWDTLVKSIKDKLYTLPDDTIVYPGHGPATTIGYEKKANPFV